MHPLGLVISFLSVLTEYQRLRMFFSCHLPVENMLEGEKRWKWHDCTAALVFKILGSFTDEFSVGLPCMFYLPCDYLALLYNHFQVRGCDVTLFFLSTVCFPSIKKKKNHRSQSPVKKGCTPAS